MLAACVASFAVSNAIAVRTWSEAVALLRHPLALQEDQALWTGLVSADLMLVQVLLMARLPWLERAWGRAALWRWHRLLGYWSFWLMVLHVLLFVVQRASRRPDAVGPALVDLFVHEHWMVWASIGTGLLVLVVVTSIAGARERMRYETWHLTHVWAYLGMGFALPHMLVARDFNSRWVTAFWWSMYVVVLLAVVWFRLAVPLVVSLRHRLRVVEVRRESPSAVTVEVGGRDLERLGAQPGQFFVWRFLAGRGRTHGHPYSVSAAPTHDRLRVTVADVGDGGVRVAGLAVGTRVLVEGPYGDLTAARRRHPTLVLLAAGIGITPMRALVEDSRLGAGTTTLVYRAGAEDEVLFAAELDGLAARRDLRVVRLVGPRRARGSWLPLGEEGDDAERLRAIVPEIASSDVFVWVRPAGPTPFVAAVRACGVARRDLHEEQFGCGDSAQAGALPELAPGVGGEQRR